MLLITQIAIIIFTAKIAGDLCVRIGQPSVLGKLLIGVILGPTFLGIVNDTEVLKELSEIGVILLMFIAGLETDIDKFKRSGKASIAVGVFGILIAFVSGYVVGSFLQMSTTESLFLGLILSATSVSISVQALKEVGKLQSREGATILGAAVIDDLLVMIGLAFMSGITGEQVNVGFVLLKMVSFFVLAILCSWKLVPWMLKRFAPLKVTETVVSAGLIIVFTFAFLAELSGVASIIGAYIAGIAISVTDYKKEVTSKVETISYSIFIPVFFTSIGIQADFSDLGNGFWTVLFLSLIAILSKLLGASIGARITSFDWNSSFLIGAAMVSRGEVALILAALGLNSRIISEELFAVIVAVILITTIVSPLLMKSAFKR